MKALFAATIFFLVLICVFISLTIPVGYWILPARVFKLGVVCKKFKQFLKYSRGLFVWKKLNLYLFRFVRRENAIQQQTLGTELWNKTSSQELLIVPTVDMLYFGPNNVKTDERRFKQDLINSDNFCYYVNKFYTKIIKQFQEFINLIQNCI